MFYHHLNDEEWKEINRRRDIRIIHLTRQNRLRTVVSREIALATDQWYLHNNHKRIPKSEKQLALDVDKVLRKIEKIQELEQEATERFDSHPILHITYEDMVANHQGTADQIADFLSLRRFYAPNPTSVRQNPEPLAELIQNYDEVSEYISMSPWAHYLDTDGVTEALVRTPYTGLVHENGTSSANRV